ncbi:MAG: AAA family ATPase, partial [Candidatus Omnitrophica bacterium]|nr:AAA family ATPase [Candidatus Omnitrophota bacterium]
LTDSQGRAVNFKNTLIIMTSNIGSQYFVDPTITIKGVEEKIKLELKSHFRPEFLNRLDEVIIFDRLDLKEIKDIVSLEVEVLKMRLRDKKIEVELTHSGREFIAERGFSPEYGARPLKRTIQKLIIDPLSVKIIGGEFKEDDKIIIDVKDRKIVFRKTENSDRYQ